MSREDDIREALSLLDKAYSEAGDDWLKDAANIQAANCLRRHASELIDENQRLRERIESIAYAMDVGLDDPDSSPQEVADMAIDALRACS